MQTTSRRIRALTLLVTSLGTFMVLLDGSIIFVALSEIQKDLGAEISHLQWTVDAYTLPFAALMLMTGTLGDRLGRKRVFLTGLVLFIAGSALCGFADGFDVLIVGRVVQGVGAAAIETASLALLVSTFTDPLGRAKAIGIWTAVSGVALALGPLVGGVLIESFSWHAIFLLNLPVGALALLLGVQRLIESKDRHTRGFDVPGQLLATAGLFCLIMGLIQGEREGWGSPLIIGLLVGSVLMFGAFVVVERRSREPLFPLELFRNRTFTASCAIASLLGFVIVGAMFFMAQYFQAVQNHSALESGLRLLPLTLGIFFLSPLASVMAGRTGPRIPIIVGALLVTAGFLLLTTVEPGTGFGAVWWKLGLVGGGIGCMFAPLTVAVMASTPPHRAGLGSSVINTTRITGFTAGAAVLGTVVVARFKDEVVAALAGLDVPAEAARRIAERVGGAGAGAGQEAGRSGDLPVSGGDFTTAVNESFVDAIHVAFLVCAGCTLLIAVLAAALMTRGRLPDQDATGGTGPSSPLVETEWLAERLGRPGIVVVDCTVAFRPLPEGGVELGSGRDGYGQGHIPGAVFADLLTELSDPTAPKPFGLLPAGRLATALEDLGISNSDTVVLYDRAHTAFATRLWWLLHSVGHDNAAVLNGGWRKWTAESRPVATGTPAAVRGTFVPRPRPELFVTREQVQTAIDDPGVCLINALSPDQHAGRIPVAHGRTGHIPSSVNVPAAALIDPATGSFLPGGQLASRLAEAGATDGGKVIAYCAAGVDATVDAFALKMLGVHDVALYDDGLVEWSGDPTLPLIATV
ncbi:DHA2 family efflux MFS transporter permease subunit [Streptomyces yaizuensis]|uniref:DHA2 family efflux MFS transporter permease subunit n=1 Tax=Streptomyces yaizuensis TaxID=2989713 RepID=A0ABQ5NSL8_9ACTN|nr:DHA2 family efflux MFS transporter permease subunit [Streptomyces sp. YSPA8]GLF93006.1 DHA2 family efflux MFS transporter permease subunit [Streptomyces sp. YSPA8]